jgi:hypothetical protein
MTIIYRSNFNLPQSLNPQDKDIKIENIKKYAEYMFFLFTNVKALGVSYVGKFRPLYLEPCYL